jgi:hypothetical protein
MPTIMLTDRELALVQEGLKALRSAAGEWAPTGTEGELHALITKVREQARQPDVPPVAEGAGREARKQPPAPRPFRRH